jgi:serpin B
MRIFRYPFILLVVAAIIAGCSVKRGEQGESVSPVPPVEPISIISTEDGNNLFALDLYAKLREEPGNLFFSPYSISTALAMTYAGARGETEKQMAKTLHFVLPEGKLHNALSRLQRDLNERGKKGAYELTVSNALWGQKGYGFLKDFLGIIASNYEGGFNEVDFASDAESVRQTINKWVEDKTNGKIKDLIGPGILDKFTRLVLTNAIYFKGNWAKQFDGNKTEESSFTLLNGEKINVSMMNQRAEFNYMETEGVQGIELPYTDDELSMFIFLPKKFDGLGDLEKSLTLENLSDWMEQFSKREVIVSVPKVRMTNQVSLVDVLRSMGMQDAFSMKADFSGMDGTKDLYISAVIHKAFVDMNEEGTEAAAATAVILRLKSAPVKAPIFRADHPFLFLIRDNKSGSILFMGRLTDPSQTEI